MKAIVYSKSKDAQGLDTCMYCVKARMKLKKEKIPFTEVEIEMEDENKRKELARTLGIDNIRTVPQIVIDDEYIGGYDALEKWIESRKNK